MYGPAMKSSREQGKLDVYYGGSMVARYSMEFPHLHRTEIEACVQRAKNHPEPNRQTMLRIELIMAEERTRDIIHEEQKKIIIQNASHLQNALLKKGVRWFPPDHVNNLIITARQRRMISNGGSIHVKKAKPVCPSTAVVPANALPVCATQPPASIAPSMNIQSIGETIKDAFTPDPNIEEWGRKLSRFMGMILEFGTRLTQLMTMILDLETRLSQHIEMLKSALMQPSDDDTGAAEMQELRRKAKHAENFGGKKVSEENLERYWRIYEKSKTVGGNSRRAVFNLCEGKAETELFVDYRPRGEENPETLYKNYRAFVAGKSESQLKIDFSKFLVS
jgi:hypothetical protein